MRNLITVIDHIVTVAPELEEHFKPFIESIRYTPPEALSHKWWQASVILSKYVLETHPKYPEILAIFNDKV